MKKRFQLKVCGMRDWNNIQELETNIKPDWMGMIFYEKSPRFVTNECGFDPQDIQLKKVGVFVNEELDKVVAIADKFQLAGIQLHGKEDWKYIVELKKKTTALIFKVFSVDNSLNWELIDKYDPFVDYYLFDTATSSHGGSGKSFDWSLLESYPFHKPFFLSGGIGNEHLATLKKLGQQLPQLIGLDINSKFEIKPGLKDIPKIMEFQTQLAIDHD
jgi:phosphoribosylanthranilate isomerase